MAMAPRTLKTSFLIRTLLGTGLGLTIHVKRTLCSSAGIYGVGRLGGNIPKGIGAART
ncbi:hypothetical protein ADIMK_2180 [Marinobacterium lacunae]|uniref:Uncharacterized protein n=1 Tax=Marinobacterium lacunae TaxID=1232683 RepID=A0A081FYW9_9GAMM|nr:hypothetical protein ADIMK_2180 [Marinobacterium lacunae]